MKPTVNPSISEMSREEIERFLLAALLCRVNCKVTLDTMADLHPHGKQYGAEAEIRTACEDYLQAQRMLEGLVEFFETSLVRMSEKIDGSAFASSTQSG